MYLHIKNGPGYDILIGLLYHWTDGQLDIVLLIIIFYPLFDKKNKKKHNKITALNLISM